VAQAQTLSRLTKVYLRLLRPGKVIFVGIAGGNGLEHIDPADTTSVIGIDISQHYLKETFARFGRRIPGLRLLKLDIAKRQPTIVRADMIWAALVLEYTGVRSALDFAANNLRSGGSLVVTIQCNNGVTAVSPTGITTVQSAAALYHAVEEEELLGAAAGMNLAVTHREESFLPNRKSFKTLVLSGWKG
jgi:hypothetical protein